MTSDYRAAIAYQPSYWARGYVARCRRDRERGKAVLPVGLWALLITVYGYQEWPDGYTNQPTNQPTTN